MNENKINEDLNKIEAREHKSVEYIKEQIELAMSSGFNNQDPQFQNEWEKIKCKGELPTIKELIEYLIDE